MAGSFVIGNMKVLLGADVSGFTKEMKKGNETVASFKKTLGTMAAAILPAMSVGAIATGIKNIADETAAYAKSVEDVSRNLGINTEEASKLLQITDDLEISQSDLEMGMKTALRQGIIPSVNGLIQLSAEYQKLPSAAEKAQFAIATFGSRAGLEMQKVLEKTPEQIQAMSDALEGSALVMSGEAVRAAKDYRLALDNLEDTWMGLKVTIGNEAIPVLVEGAEELADFLAVNIRQNKALDELDKALDRGIITKKEYNRATNEMTDGLFHQTINLEGLAKVEDMLASNLMLVTSNMSAGMGDLRAYESGMQEMAEASEQAADANARVAVEIIKATEAAWSKEAIDLLTKAYKDGLVTEELYEYKLREIMSGFMGLSEATINGSLALRDIREDMEEGEISALDAYNAVMLYAEGLEGLDGKTVNTYVNTTFEQRGTNYHYTPPAALGGSMAPTYTTSRPEYHQFGSDFIIPPGYSGDTYPIGWGSSGERVTVTPSGRNGNEDIIAAIKDSRLNEDRLARRLRDAVLKLVR